MSEAAVLVAFALSVALNVVLVVVLVRIARDLLDAAMSKDPRVVQPRRVRKRRPEPVDPFANLTADINASLAAMGDAPEPVTSKPTGLYGD